MSDKNRLGLCFQYRLRGLSRASLIYLAIFLAADLILPAAFYLLIGRPLNNDQSTFQIAAGTGQQASTSFWFSAVIFIFVGACASFREDFNFLLNLNNTRRNQYLSALPLMALTAGVFLALGLVSRILEILVESLVNQRTLPTAVSVYFQGYTGASLPAAAANLLLYFTSFILAFTFGQIVGVLSYRFGRRFIIPFWICFGFSFMIIPLVSVNNHWLQRFIAWLLGQEAPLPALNLSIHLLVVAVLLAALSGLAYRRLPQSA